MTEAIRFLHAFAQVLSTAALYAPGHPATVKSLEVLWRALEELLGASESPTFLFLGGAPIYEGRALHELAQWPWGPRLSAHGVQRLEFDRHVSPEGLELFVTRVQRRIEAGAVDPDPEASLIEGIRFGMVEVVEGGGEEETSEPVESPDAPAGPVLLDLTDELEAMGFILGEAEEGRLARSESDVVVRILAGQLDQFAVPELEAPRTAEGYSSYLALQTALLAMAVAGQAGIERRGRHLVGVAALLADIGMMRLGEPFAQREVLDGSSRPLMEEHTTRGAAFLLAQGGTGAELAAAVALEHHLRPDGNGYPARRFSPPPHWVSRVVAVCSTYGALRVARPFRPAWATPQILQHLEESAGTVYDAESARALVSLVRSARAG